MNPDQQQPNLSPSLPLKRLVEKLAKGKSLRELVEKARWRRVAKARALQSTDL